MPLEQLMIHNNKRFHSNRTIAKGHISKMRCNLCGHNLTKDEEEYEDDSKGLNCEILQARSINSSDTVNTIEYLSMCLDCKYQTPYGYLWFAICDGREHVLTSEHKQVTITEINWQNDKALEILRIEIKSAEQ
jgi:hypothetical protein